jgi:hypothetical protein
MDMLRHGRSPATSAELEPYERRNVNDALIHACLELPLISVLLRREGDVEYGTEKLIFAPFLGHSVQTREHVKRG